MEAFSVVFALLGATICGVLLMLVMCVLYISYRHRLYRHIPTPAPPRLFFGHLLLIKEIGKRMTVTERLQMWNTQLGPLFCIHIVFRTVVMCSDSGVIKEVLTKSKYLKSKDQYRAFHSLYGARSLGNGLVSEMDHQVWMKKRAMINPAFHRKYLMGLMSPFNECSDKLVSHLTKFADGTTAVPMLKEFERLTMEIISKVGFGIQDEIIENPDHPIHLLFPVLIGGMESVYRKPFLKYSIFPWDVRYRREVRCAANQIRAIGRKCILDRVKALKEGAEVPKDILTFILQESNNLEGEKEFALENMVDEFVTFFGAGGETTANLLSFALLHLGQNPDMMDKLRQEVDTVLEGKDFIEYEDINKMQYLTWVLKETLRINPPVGMLNRELPEDMEICGYNVPKSTVILFPIYGMGRNEKHFKNPEKFDPERFGRDEDSPAFAYMPFSIGSRSCIGKTFAMIEAKVVMCKLLQHLEFKLDPYQNMGFREAITLKPKDNCRNYITLRET